MADNQNDPNYAAYQQALKSGFGGMSSTQVKQVQNYLNVYHGAKLSVDGVAGFLTNAALKGGSGSSSSSGSSDALVQKQYGSWAWALQNSELKKVLDDAASAGLTSDQLQAKIEQTKWWRSTSGTARAFQQLQKEDPASANAQIKAMTDNLRQQSLSMGINLSSIQLSKMATTSLQVGWNAQEQRQAIGAEFMYNPGKAAAGEAAVDKDTLQQMAGDYGVSLSDKTMGQWMQQILEGNNTTDGYKDYLTQQAKSLYPTIAGALDQGVTVAQYFDPYRQMAAQTLDLSPDAISLTDPKYNKMINSIDPKTGARIPMSISDAATMLRSDPVYNYKGTIQAKDAAYSFVNGLSNTFGITNTNGVSSQLTGANQGASQ